MTEPILYAIPVFIVLIALEAWLGRNRSALYDIKDTAACLAMGTGNVAVNALVGTAIFLLYLAAYDHRLFEFNAGHVSTWVILLFAEDLCYYAFHRFHHESRIGWAGHVTHHSSTHYNLAVALRQSWTTSLTGAVFWLPLALLGFHPLMIVSQQAISLIYQFWIHTQSIKTLGPLEWILNTPSHHRVHHGSNLQYIDRNYGGILIIWDRLFGSFEAEDETVEFGLTNNINTYNPLRIAFHEWVAMAKDIHCSHGIRQKLSVLFRHPKWFNEQTQAVNSKPPRNTR